MTGMHTKGRNVRRRIEDTMTVRTTRKTVTFMHPFSLTGMFEAHPAGTYIVETDEELLRASSVQAYRRIATMIRLSTRSTVRF